MREAGRSIGAMRSADDGVTIVELLISLVILLSVFGALASVIITTLGSVRNNEARAGAVALANELVEEMTSVPWEQLGLSSADEDLPDVPDGEDVLTYGDEAESVVLLDPAINPIPEHLTRFPDPDDGFYEVKRWVTWFEEEGQPELKRMIVEVTWEVGGREATIRSDGLRSPDIDELFDLEVSVSVESEIPHPDADGTADWLVVSPTDSGEYRNEHKFVVTAQLGDVPSSSELRFRDRNGKLHVVPAPETPPGSTIRQWPIAVKEYQFRHGRTAFTVVAEGLEGDPTAAGLIASDTATLRFYQDLFIPLPELDQEGQVVLVSSPPDLITAPFDQQRVHLDTAGNLCGSLRVEVDVEGMTPAEATPTAGEGGGLRLTRDPEAEPLASEQMGLVNEEVFGGRYFNQITNENRADFFGELSGAVGEERTVQLNVYAERIADPPFDADDAEPTFTRTFEFDTIVVGTTCP